MRLLSGTSCKGYPPWLTPSGGHHPCPSPSWKGTPAPSCAGGVGEGVGMGKVRAVVL